MIGFPSGTQWAADVVGFRRIPAAKITTRRRICSYMLLVIFHHQLFIFSPCGIDSRLRQGILPPFALELCMAGGAVATSDPS